MGIWIEEREVFAPEWDRLIEEVKAEGHEVVCWPPAWTELDALPTHLWEGENRVFFHVSLELAARLAALLHDVSPGVLCDEQALRCSAWYGDFETELVHQHAWYMTTARALVEQGVDARVVGGGAACFVRPDSPLKPFSGRVLARDGITLDRLDHGFYYEDEELPIVVASCREIGVEWRLVIVHGRLISGSAYDAATRTTLKGESGSAAYDFAQEVLSRHDMRRFGQGCVMDVAQVDGVWRVMEFNPLSGASLYGCDLGAVARALLDEPL